MRQIGGNEETKDDENFTIEKFTYDNTYIDNFFKGEFVPPGFDRWLIHSPTKKTSPKYFAPVTRIYIYKYPNVENKDRQKILEYIHKRLVTIYKNKPDVVKSINSIINEENEDFKKEKQRYIDAERSMEPFFLDKYMIGEKVNLLFDLHKSEIEKEFNKIGEITLPSITKEEVPTPQINDSIPKENSIQSVEKDSIQPVEKTTSGGKYRRKSRVQKKTKKVGKKNCKKTARRRRRK